MVEIGNVQLTAETIEYIYHELNEHYLITYRTVYQIHYAKNYGYYGSKIYYKQKDNTSGYVPLTKRGRYITCDGTYLNKLIGFQLVNE